MIASEEEVLSVSFHVWWSPYGFIKSSMKALMGNKPNSCIQTLFQDYWKFLKNWKNWTFMTIFSKFVCERHFWRLIKWPYIFSVFRKFTIIWELFLNPAIWVNIELKVQLQCSFKSQLGGQAKGKFVPVRVSPTLIEIVKQCDGLMNRFLQRWNFWIVRGSPRPWFGLFIKLG